MENELDFEEIVNLNLKIHHFFGNLYPVFDSKRKILEYVIRAIIFVGKLEFYYHNNIITVNQIKIS